jgi:histidine triad (HIT) family protein
MEGCTFCRIVAGQLPAAVIAEDDDVIVFLSLEDHPLVVPKPHVPDLFALSEALGAAVMRQTIRVATALKIGLGCDGVYLTQANGTAAGQDVFHLHLHLYPRWHGDGAGYAPGTVLPGRWPREEIRARITGALRRP